MMQAGKGHLEEEAAGIKRLLLSRRAWQQDFLVGGARLVPVAWPGAEVGYLKHPPQLQSPGQDTLGTIARTRRFNCKRRVKVDDNIESGTSVQLH